MWDTIVGFVKALFTGKGTTQIGSRNRSVSGVSFGDNANAIIADNVHVTTDRAAETSKPKEISLTARAARVILEAAESRDGIVYFIRVSGVCSLRANGKDFGVKDSPREEAIRVEDMRILRTDGFLEATSDTEEIFQLTAAGFNAADIIRGDPSFLAQAMAVEEYKDEEC